MKKPLIERFQKLAGIKSVNKLTEQMKMEQEEMEKVTRDTKKL